MSELARVSLGRMAVIEFKQAIGDFKAFIEHTYSPEDWPLELWGNPLWFGEHKVQVYGLDLETWCMVTLEWTPTRLIMVIPSSTPVSVGQSIHQRLIAAGLVDASAPFQVSDPLWALVGEQQEGQGQ